MMRGGSAVPAGLPDHKSADNCQVLHSGATQLSTCGLACERVSIPAMSKVTIKAMKFLAVSWCTFSLIVSGASGMVLCVGADGHVSLELAHQGRCRDSCASGSRGRVSEIESNAQRDCCGGCVDVSLSSDTVLQLAKEVRRDRLLSDTGYRGVGNARAVVGSSDTACLMVLPGGQPCLSALLLAQRTIVLRI